MREQERTLQLAALVKRARNRRPEPAVHVSEDIDLALTPTQYALWLHGERQGDLASVLAPWVALMEGEVAVDHLARCLRAVVRRHPALRTTIVGTAEGPRRRIHRTEVPVAILDVPEGTPDSEREAAAVRLIRERDAKVSPSGPVYSFTLVRISDRAVVIGLTVHHLFFDGRSMRILFDDVGRWYEQEPGEVDKVAFAPAVDGPAKPESAASASDYWRAELAGVPEPAQPSSDGLGVSTASRIERTVVPEAAEAVRKLAAYAGVSLFSVTMTALSLCLRQFGAGEQVVLAVPVDIRSGSQQEEIGYFVNTVPVRADLRDEGVAGKRAIQAVGRSVAGALGARQLPVQEIMKIWRRESGRPLLHPFPALLDVVEGGSHDLLLPRVEVKPVEGVKGHADFPFVISLVDERKHMNLTMDYREGTIEAEQAHLVADQMVRALCFLGDNSDRPIGEFFRDDMPSVFFTGLSSESRPEKSPTAAASTTAEVGRAFHEVLELTGAPNASDDFFDLGGQSMAAARLVNRVRKSLGVKVSLREIFDHPTVEELASLIDGRREGQ